MDMLEYAKQYVGLGFAVFPLRVRDKVPATEHGCKDATRDIDQVINWWTECPDYNIGIACGSVSDGLVVIDIDDHDDKHGMQSYQEWAGENGKLPETCVATTGTGGKHLLYRTTKTYKNKTNLYDNIDVRADGGYIVAPPSIHPNGNIYKWDISPFANKITWMDNKVEMFLNGKQKTDTQQVQNEKFNVGEVVYTGNRVSTLVKLIGSLKASGLSDAAIIEAVKLENEAKCNPPLSIKELEKEVLPALERNWRVERPYQEQMIMEVDDIPLPIAWEEMQDNPPAVRPELIHGVLRKGHKMSILAPSKGAKTFSLLELAIAIAHGQKWLGMQCEQGKVMYINMEVEHASVYNRLEAIRTALGIHEISKESLYMWTLRGTSKTLDDLMPEIIKMCKGFTAIIIDPLYKVLKGDENSNTDMRGFVTLFDRIAQKTGASVIYAHHFAKGSMGERKSIDRGSGAGVFGRDPDAILTMTELETDTNDGSTGWRVEFTLREFAEHEPIDVWWRYPLHVLDEDGELEEADYYSPAKKGNETKKDKRIKLVWETLQKLPIYFQMQEFKNAYPKKSNGTALAKYLTEAGCTKGQDGYWRKP